ncbi:MAG: DUF134 domain-containing protein [Ruminococcaceae bacterium]|nr:DUF134 domain-containing protein [Oscillospiraceae bacterium]
MSRPRKCRRVCRFPQTMAFIPADGEETAREVVLTVDEYETIRLIDLEGFSQEQCGAYMKIARTTVQQIYTEARRKLARMLVEGCRLRIAGGDYELCRGGESHGGCEGCQRQRLCMDFSKPEGEDMMRIAVTYANGQIFQHFGHTEQFKVYDIADGKIVSAKVMDTNGQGHGALAGILGVLGVDTLICGGIGGGARAALDAAGIRLYGGVSGDADAAVQALLEGTLAYNPDVKCNHHGEHHHHGGNCGEHGCHSGEHKCHDHDCKHN